MAAEDRPFWAETEEAVLARHGTTRAGLAGAEASARRRLVRGRALHEEGRAAPLRLLAAQFGDPMVLLLAGAAALSFAIGDVTDGTIVGLIVLASGLLGFVQEYSAARAMARLLDRVRVRAEVRRDGAWLRVPVAEVVPGDVVRLAAGATVPGDARLLETNRLSLDEAALTGEPWAVEKAVEAVPAEAAAERRSAVFFGTHVVSGSGVAVVVAVGSDTVYGRLGEHVRHRRGPSEFQLGLQRFGALLLRVTGALVVAVLGVHVAFDRPVLDAFLFAVALAVGLVPELLPAIVTITLATGARRMARGRVIVKRLAAIEDFGAIDVLCADKTGTLTEGEVRVHAAVDPDGRPDPRVLAVAAVNSRLQTSFTNPIDAAVDAAAPAAPLPTRVAELPYDFVRKRLSVLVDGDLAGQGPGRWLVTKGAVAETLARCVTVAGDGGPRPLAAVDLGRVQAEVAGAGHRILAVAVRRLEAGATIDPAAEAGLHLLGFLVLADPPKAGVAATVARLRDLGVRLVMVTGDHRLVAGHVARAVGLPAPAVLTGRQLRELGDDALARRVREVDVFAEVEPDQKERIVRALRRTGHAVGYLGDGINDAAAMHAADVAISVDDAVDVAKEAADVVLLEPSLDVLASGVEEGRRTFANTLKYVQITTSANLGNMVSMAGASLFLPFLPLLPKQILLNNFLSDIPSIAIGGDRVDAEAVARPRRWDVAWLRTYMLVFGGVSAIFDFLCFAALLGLAGTTEDRFRTGWFVVSVLTELLVLLIIRTTRRAWRSRPSPLLAGVTVAVAAVAVGLPYSPAGPPLGLVPLPAPWLATLLGITLAYGVASELVKAWFHRRWADGSPSPRPRAAR